MKVRITIDVNEADRVAIAHHFGERGAAGRNSVETWIQATLDAALEDIIDDFRKAYPIEDLKW